MIHPVHRLPDLGLAPFPPLLRSFTQASSHPLSLLLPALAPYLSLSEQVGHSHKLGFFPSPPPTSSHPVFLAVLGQHVHGDVGAAAHDEHDVGAGPLAVVGVGGEGGAQEGAAAVGARERGAAGDLDEEAGVVDEARAGGHGVGVRHDGADEARRCLRLGGPRGGDALERGGGGGGAALEGRAEGRRGRRGEGEARGGAGLGPAVGAL